jgi:hypothetical protein
MNLVKAGAGVLFAALGISAVVYVEAQEAPKTPSPVRASAIIGMPVQSFTGELIGEVKDIILETNGTATHVVVSYGGAFGIGGKLVAMPWVAAAAMMSGNRLVVDRLRLQRAPTLPDNKWPDLANRGWSTEADRYWQSTSSARAPSGTDVDSPDRSRRRQTPTDRSRDRPQ